MGTKNRDPNRPALLMQKLRSRGEPLQRYENEAFLGRLLEGYRQVGELLQKRRKLEFLEFDIDELDSEAIAREVEVNCRSGQGQPISSAPGC